MKSAKEPLSSYLTSQTIFYVLVPVTICLMGIYWLVFNRDSSSTVQTPANYVVTQGPKYSMKERFGVYINRWDGTRNRNVSPYDYDVAKLLKVGWVMNGTEPLEILDPNQIEKFHMVFYGDPSSPNYSEANKIVSAETCEVMRKKILDDYPEHYPPYSSFTVGNELGFDDRLTAEEYADIFVRWSKCLKSINPTFQMSLGTIVSFRSKVPNYYMHQCVGLNDPNSGGNYFRKIINRIKAAHGNQWLPDSISTHGYMVCYKNWEEEFREKRTLMKELGLQDRDLIVKEFNRTGATMEETKNNMTAEVNVFASLKDPAIGHPQDEGRLVQRWAWFTLLEGYHPEKPDENWSLWTLIDHKTKQVTMLGQNYNQLVDKWMTSNPAKGWWTDRWKTCAGVSGYTGTHDQMASATSGASTNLLCWQSSYLYCGDDAGWNLIPQTAKTQGQSRRVTDNFVIGKWRCLQNKWLQRVAGYCAPGDYLNVQGEHQNWALGPNNKPNGAILCSSSRYHLCIDSETVKTNPWYETDLVGTRHRKAAIGEKIGAWECNVTTQRWKNTFSPVGNIESVTCDKIIGWVCDPALSNYSWRVEVYRDGKKGEGGVLVTEIGATQVSTTGATSCGEGANHGFVFQIPAQLKSDGQLHTYYFYTKQPTIEGSPNKLISATATQVPLCAGSCSTNQNCTAAQTCNTTTHTCTNLTCTTTNPCKTSTAQNHACVEQNKANGTSCETGKSCQNGICQALAIATTQPLACQSDLNSDNQVGTTDLLQVLGAWGSTCTGCKEDIDKDGKVSASDLILVISGWGVCGSASIFSLFTRLFS